MDPAFQRAALLRPRSSDQPCILGLRLHPLTVGHLFLFVQYDALTFSVDKRTDLSEFFLALFVCARPWRRAERDLRSWWFGFFCRVWTLSNAKRDWLAELVRFREWLDQQYDSPSMRLPERAKAKRTGAPVCWNRLTFLVTRCGMSVDAALDTPLQTANALFATWADGEGLAELHYVDPNSALWEFARQEDLKRFNADGTRKEALN